MKTSAVVVGIFKTCIQYSQKHVMPCKDLGILFSRILIVYSIFKISVAIFQFHFQENQCIFRLNIYSKENMFKNLSYIEEFDIRGG